MKTVCCRITGTVQGVWFRGSTQDRARALGVTGWARNCADGSVEVLAHGPGEAIDLLVAWLHEGPRLASVKRVEVEPSGEAAPPTFEVR